MAWRSRNKSETEDVTIKARDIDLFDTPKLARNLWTQQDIAEFKIELTQRVQPHETILLKVTQDILSLPLSHRDALQGTAAGAGFRKGKV